MIKKGGKPKDSDASISETFQKYQFGISSKEECTKLVSLVFETYQLRIAIKDKAIYQSNNVFIPFMIYFNKVCT